MKKRHLASIAFVTIILFIFFSVAGKSDGGPPYNSKAPGDKTCSGAEGAPCHGDGLSDNLGPGTPSIIFDNGNTTYVPGQTYVIKPRITHPTFEKFGFQIVSLRNSDNKFTGTVTLLDTLKTRMQKPTWGSFQDRNFVMHRLAGTVPASAKTGQWTYSWKAPATSQGTITFYACFLAANGNNSNDNGDQTYYTKLAITPAPISVEPDPATNFKVSVFPNPATTVLQVKCDIDLSNAAVQILNLSGQTVSAFTNSGSNFTEVDIAKLWSGIYILQIVANDQRFSQKFLKQ